MTSGSSVVGPSRQGRVGLADAAALVALVYGVVLGGTVIGELSPSVAAVNGTVAAVLILVYIWRAPSMADRIDKLVLAAVLLFLAACVVSLFPRQSFETALAAVAYAAAFFLARGIFSAPVTRLALIRTFIALSAVMTVITALRWGAYVLEWMSLSGWQTFPALNMALPSIPWGHRHDLALLMVMLYPAWWVGTPSTLRRAGAALIGALLACMVVLDGSRTLWLAIATASGVTTLAFLRSRLRMRVTRIRATEIVIAIVLVGGGLVVASGLGATLLQRMVNLDSVGSRTAMWSALVDWWVAHPIAGGGPGSFPWLLQGSGFFDTSSFAPRHPDNAAIQLLGEAGLLGLGALALLLIAVVPPLARNMSPAATSALVAFAVASLGSNPTESVFTVLVAIGWAAYGIPRSSEDSGARSPDPSFRRSRAVIRGVTVGGTVVVAAAWALTVFGATAYADARRAISLQNFPTAADALDRAIALDPGMALYVRQRGTLEYVMGNPDAATADLRRATVMNPHDDLAWRLVALAEMSTDHLAAADRALGRAVDLRRSDPTNLLLTAAWALDRGEARAALDTMAEVVQAWPQIVTARTWDEFVAAADFDTADVVAAAFDRWELGLSSPELVSDQGVWLSVLNGRPGSLDRAIVESGDSEVTGDAAAALLACRPATSILATSSAEDLRTQVYWRWHLRNAAVTGTTDPDASRIYELMTRLRLSDAGDALNPLDENSVRGTSPDIWGYRRQPVSWPSSGSQLPSPIGGLLTWLEGSDCDR